MACAVARRGSSVAEQGTHKPLVESSTLSPATLLHYETKATEQFVTNWMLDAHRNAPGNYAPAPAAPKPPAPACPQARSRLRETQVQINLLTASFVSNPPRNIPQNLRELYV